MYFCTGVRFFPFSRLQICLQSCFFMEHKGPLEAPYGFHGAKNEIYGSDYPKKVLSTQGIPNRSPM